MLHVLAAQFQRAEPQSHSYFMSSVFTNMEDSPRLGTVSSTVQRLWQQGHALSRKVSSSNLKFNDT